MNVNVIKRDSTIEAFSQDKIKIAVEKAMKSIGEVDSDIATKVAKRVSTKAKKEDNTDIEVNDIHVLVENTLMDMKLHAIAREYITYRANNQPDIFRRRDAYKPFEYPVLNKYVDAIQQSYWVHTEFDYNGDIQDFKVILNDSERESIRRCMLAISQIEVKVKDFWGKVGDKLPKPEIQEVGATFAESEVRHSKAYSHLLEILGLNSNFADILDIPVFKKRLAYISKAMVGAKSDNNRDYIESLLFFTLFIENVSLFSQFLIISSFNKEKAVLKGMANAIAATSLEENLHAMFGEELIATIREEKPEYFDEVFSERVYSLTRESLESEKEMIDWIFENGETDILSKQEVLEYIKSRYNKGLVACGFEAIFDVDKNALDKTRWFDVQIMSGMKTDFFKARVVSYSKHVQSYTEDDLF